MITVGCREVEIEMNQNTPPPHQQQTTRHPDPPHPLFKPARWRADGSRSRVIRGCWKPWRRYPRWSRKETAEEGAKRPQLKVWGWMACRRSSAVASRLNVARNTNHGLGVDERPSVIDLEIVKYWRESRIKEIHAEVGGVAEEKISLEPGFTSIIKIYTSQGVPGILRCLQMRHCPPPSSTTFAPASRHLKFPPPSTNRRDLPLVMRTVNPNAVRLPCLPLLPPPPTPKERPDGNDDCHCHHGPRLRPPGSPPLPVWLRWAATPQFGTPHPPASGLQGWDWVGWGVLYRLLAMQHCWASSRCAYAAYIGAGHPPHHSHRSGLHPSRHSYPLPAVTPSPTATELLTEDLDRDGGPRMTRISSVQGVTRINDSGSEDGNVSTSLSQRTAAPTSNDTVEALSQALKLAQTENAELKARVHEVEQMLARFSAAGIKPQRSPRHPNPELETCAQRYSKYFATMNEIWLDKSALCQPCPEDVDLSDPDRYEGGKDTDRCSLITAELFQVFPKNAHETLESDELFAERILHHVTEQRWHAVSQVIKQARELFSDAIMRQQRQLAGQGEIMIDIGRTEELIRAIQDRKLGSDIRAASPELQGLIFSPGTKSVVVSNVPPILYRHQRNKDSDILRDDSGPNGLRSLLFGPGALGKAKVAKNQSVGYKWSISRITPGALSLLSVPDVEFKLVGEKSQIDYKEHFVQVKCLLVSIAESPLGAKIIEHWSGKVFEGVSGIKNATTATATGSASANAVQEADIEVSIRDRLRDLSLESDSDSSSEEPVVMSVRPQCPSSAAPSSTAPQQTDTSGTTASTSSPPTSQLSLSITSEINTASLPATSDQPVVAETTPDFDADVVEPLGRGRGRGAGRGRVGMKADNGQVTGAATSAVIPGVGGMSNEDSVVAPRRRGRSAKQM
ncbi:hypothetical protein BDZ89DRAFT_1054474 [Hymenopellis radicata]|nr:hypothetical protein BDZ89DRAFT_1054474 [Hymenopellis radicata]